jgi:hypothetical protein
MLINHSTFGLCLPCAPMAGLLAPLVGVRAGVAKKPEPPKPMTCDAADNRHAPQRRVVSFSPVRAFVKLAPRPLAITVPRWLRGPAWFVHRRVWIDTVDQAQSPGDRLEFISPGHDSRAARPNPQVSWRMVRR